MVRVDQRCVGPAARMVAVGGLILGCQSAPPEPAGRSEAKPVAHVPSSQPRRVAARPAAHLTPAPDDPVDGEWTLTKAVEGLAGTGPLHAAIEAGFGRFDCRLYDDKAPLTVATFIGLARGTRPWKDSRGRWVRRPAYYGGAFYRIVRGTLIEGGDIRGDGSNPGFAVPDEIWEGATHDRAGLLCMANQGPDTNGARFFITEGPARELDGGNTIFGECGPEELIHQIAAVEVVGQRPKMPVLWNDVKIYRDPS